MGDGSQVRTGEGEMGLMGLMGLITWEHVLYHKVYNVVYKKLKRRVMITRLGIG